MQRGTAKTDIGQWKFSILGDAIDRSEFIEAEPRSPGRDRVRDVMLRLF